ncbi:unnamed protein product [Macrosiphum euphorbiae]|uniref:ATP-dependent DNA helicase n=1 Tax=Macrosiphum euphorbiae TaxID=13131 RepID=A0AAV0WRZ2_9HEMI|nr:unnamed protein product [Macrosiphum euphorbiae]
MNHRFRIKVTSLPEALDRTLKNFKVKGQLRGGFVILFVGDFWQILPTVPEFPKINEINSCLKSKNLWS